MGQDWGMIMMITFAPKLRLHFTVFRRCSTRNFGLHTSSLYQFGLHTARLDQFLPQEVPKNDKNKSIQAGQKPIGGISIISDFASWPLAF